MAGIGFDPLEDRLTLVRSRAGLQPNEERCGPLVDLLPFGPCG